MRHPLAPSSAERRDAGPAAAPSSWPTIRTEFAESLLAHYPGPVVVTDSDGRPLAANRAGGEIVDLLRNPNAVDLHDAIGAVRRQRATKECVLSLGVGQKTRYCSLSVLPIDTAAGAATGFLLLARDITLQENLRQVLVESRGRFKDLVECSTDFVWETDKAGRFVYVTPRGALGYSAAELVGQSAADLLTDEWDSRFPWPFQCEEAMEGIEISVLCKDRAEAILSIACTPIKNDYGTAVGSRGIARDVTEARARDAALAHALARERLLGDIVNTIRDEVEPQTLLQTAARAAASGLSCSWSWIYRTDGEGGLTRVSEFLNGDADIDVQEVDAAATRFAKDGARRPISVGQYLLIFEATRYRDKINGALCVARRHDETPFTDDDSELLSGVASQLGIAIEQIGTHEQLLELSQTDGLTKLLNRRAFVEETRARLANADRAKRPAALFYIDMNNLKALNDLKGHKDGDAALVVLADILRRHTRIQDPVARLGGDEFAIWFDNMTAEVAKDKARQLVQSGKALEALSADFSHPLGLAVGVALFDPACPETLDELFERADEAMYRAKKAGKAGKQVYALSRAQDRR